MTPEMKQVWFAHKEQLAYARRFVSDWLLVIDGIFKDRLMTRWRSVWRSAESTLYPTCRSDQIRDKSDKSDKIMVGATVTICVEDVDCLLTTWPHVWPPIHDTMAHVMHNFV